MYINHKALIVPEDPGTLTLKVPVLKVYDGDGFLTKISPMPGVEVEATVRFGFIDAPEIAQPGGKQARDFLISLIGGKSVDIAILTKMDTGQSVDRYRRIVCVPYLTEDHPATETNQSGFWTSLFGTRRSLTRNIELEMVLNGWAWVLDRYGPGEQYFDALEEARRFRRGIWADDGNIHPWEFKKQKYKVRNAVKAIPVQQTKSLSNPANVCCPKDGCSGRMIERNGKHGKFLGCSNFPKCKVTRNQ